MKRQLSVGRKIVYAAIGFVVIAALAYWAYEQYGEGTRVSLNPSGMSSAEAHDANARNSPLVFERKVFGDCSIHDAWIEEVSAWRTKYWFGFALEGYDVPMTAIYVVRDVPPNGGKAEVFMDFVEANAKHRLSGLGMQAVTIEGKPYWFYAGSTVSPPPEVFEFACGEPRAKARVRR